MKTVFIIVTTKGPKKELIGVGGVYTDFETAHEDCEEKNRRSTRLERHWYSEVFEKTIEKDS